MDLLKWFINFLIKKTYTNQLLENLGKEKYTHIL